MNSAKWGKLLFGNNKTYLMVLTGHDHDSCPWLAINMTDYSSLSGLVMTSQDQDKEERVPEQVRINKKYLDVSILVRT